MPHILFNKPYNVICQFSAHEKFPSLADFIDIKNIYSAGRLDANSEGLVLLTSDSSLQHAISHPDHKLSKTYLVQVEGIPKAQTLARLELPLSLCNFTTQGARARLIEAPDWLWARTPPIRKRHNLPTSWLSLTLFEGKNRQVRRMSAAVGLPTLRLIRQAIGPFTLENHPLLPGEWCAINDAILRKYLKKISIKNYYPDLKMIETNSVSNSGIN